jgi:hypothetical protein
MRNMDSKSTRGRVMRAIFALMVAALLAWLVPVLTTASGAVDSSKRVRFLPRFTAGETLRYQIESRTTTTGKATAPIENPQGGSLLKQSADLLVKLEVLGVDGVAAPAAEPGNEKGSAKGAPGAAPAMGRIHMRATYEKSSAKTETDGYDPTAASIEEQYNRLEGRSMEFTVEPDGKISEMKGIEDVLQNPSQQGAAQSWMSGIASGAGFPKEGIVPGQKWSNERPLEGTPLGGLVWHTESTYLRNEPCEMARTAAAPASAASAGAADASAAEMCAVILTRFEILRSAKGDETPEDYRRNGLRTSGVWTGAGQSLDSISLSSSLLVSSTQTSKQDMNFDIVSATAGSKIHYGGHVESESEIRLLPGGAPGAASAPASPSF